MRKVILLALIGCGLAGCYKKDWQAAIEENKRLQTELDTAKAENQKLKQTSTYYWQSAADAVAAKDFQSALGKLQDLVAKFPDDPLVPRATANISALKSEIAAQAKVAAKAKADAERKAAEEEKRQYEKLVHTVVLAPTTNDDYCNNHGQGDEFHISGGAFSENNEVASLMGCVREEFADNDFCCERSNVEKISARYGFIVFWK